MSLVENCLSLSKLNIEQIIPISEYPIVPMPYMYTGTPYAMSAVTTLICKHKFHTPCIGAWWCAPRDHHNPEGTCPLCRSPTFKGSCVWRWNSRKGRVALLKRLAKKGNVPKQIIRVVNKFNKSKNEYRESLEKQRAYSKEHKEIFRMDRKLRNVTWRKRMRMNHLEGQLAAFDPMALINLII